MPTIPLVTLRPILATGWPREARRLPSPTGPDPRLAVLEQPIGATLSFRLRQLGDGRLRARVSLVSKRSRSANGSARLCISVREDGRLTILWSGVLASFWGRPVPRFAEIDVPLTGIGMSDADLIFSAHPIRKVGAGVDRVRWERPVIDLAPTQAPASPLRTPEVGSGETKEETPIQSKPNRTLAASGVPLISILTPVHDPDPAILEETLASVRRQTFQDWELCIADDGSRDPDVVRILKAVAEEDPRVRLMHRDEAGGISRATNTALAGATGEYVALLDHDDVLVDDALEAMAEAIAETPEADMLYSDEDVFDDSRRIAAFLKPNWSPDLMRSQMYTCHLGVYRRALATEVGGFQPDLDGSQDYDFVLRISERTERIVHVPRVLYHWRSHQKSTAGNVEAKLYAFSAARRAIAQHLERTGIDASVNFGAARGLYRIVYPSQRRETTNMILPVSNVSLAYLEGLRSAARSWLLGEHKSWELTLVGTTGVIEECVDALPNSVREERLQTVPTGPALCRSAMLNLAARSTTADYLIMLDGPVEALSFDWLSSMVGYSSQAGVGVVGAKTLAFDGRVEHAGIVLWEGLPVPVRQGAEQSDPGPNFLLQVAGNFSAVSGTVALKRENMELLGGFDEQFAALGEIDLSLRALELGLRNVLAPDAVLRRPENLTPVNNIGELVAFQERWKDRICEDRIFSGEALAQLTDLAPVPSW